MKRLLFVLLAVVLFVAACKNTPNQKKGTLDKVFIQSFKNGKFTALEKFFPTKAFYKSLGNEVEDRNDADIDSFLSRSNQKLMDSWEKMNNTLKEKKIDPAKITFKESVVYNPFRSNSFQAMVIVYEYDGKTWDDLSMIIRQKGDTTYLLEIPNPTRAFSMTDTSLAESLQAKIANELKTPAFKETLTKQVAQLVDWAKTDNLAAFAVVAAYHGDDENRSWKSPVNMQNEEEKALAKKLIQDVKEATSGCADFTYDEIQAEKESEGYWIVQPVKCSDKIIYFAFLKVKDKLLLGDFNVEMTGKKMESDIE